MKWTTSIITIIAVVIIATVAIFAYFTYGSGVLEIKMTDSPADWGVATQVYLNFSAIEVHRADAGNESGWFTAVNSGSINVTETLDVNKTIGSKNLQAGLYNIIRFTNVVAKVTVGGINYTAIVPSGEITIPITKGGIRVDIRVNTGQTTTMLIDLNIKVQGSAPNFTIVPAARATPA